MKNEAGLHPMKRGFATRRVFRALRFTATKLLLHTNRKACTYIPSRIWATRTFKQISNYSIEEYYDVFLHADIILKAC